LTLGREIILKSIVGLEKKLREGLWRFKRAKNGDTLGEKNELWVSGKEKQGGTDRQSEHENQIRAEAKFDYVSEKK